MVIAVPETTPTQRLAATLLGQSLDEWIVARRQRGLSWGSIAADLAVTTNGIVDLNRETLRTWYQPRRKRVFVLKDADQYETEYEWELVG